MAATVPTYRVKGSRDVGPQILADQLEKLLAETACA
jgi:hypothetical protein